MVEIIVAVAILAIIFSLGLILSMDFYKTYAFNYEKDLVVGILQKARSKSMANIGQLTHGVTFDATEHQYIEFHGTFSPTEITNQAIEANTAIAVTWPSEVVFSQLEGACQTCGGGLISITLSGLGKTSTITINNEGRIDY